MRPQAAFASMQHARAITAWRICACAIDRSFVVIRLKHLAV
jgi:hypothetical protein